MSRSNLEAGIGQVIPLAVIAVVLAAAYVVIDRYTGGQKDMLTVETRGLHLVSALSKYKRDSGNYPDSLAKLVPNYLSGAATCPDGSAMSYAATAGEYTLSCQNVIFKYKPYRYDSRLKSWSG